MVAFQLGQILEKGVVGRVLVDLARGGIVRKQEILVKDQEVRLALKLRQEPGRPAVVTDPLAFAVFFIANGAEINIRINRFHGVGDRAEILAIIIPGQLGFAGQSISRLPGTVKLVADFPVANLEAHVDIHVFHPSGCQIGGFRYAAIAGGGIIGGENRFGAGHFAKFNKVVG